MFGIVPNSPIALIIYLGLPIIAVVGLEIMMRRGKKKQETK